MKSFGTFLYVCLSASFFGISIGAASALMWSIFWVCHGKEGAKLQGEALDLLVNQHPTLTCGHELWTMTKRTQSQIQAAEIGFQRMVIWRGAS